MSWLKLNDSFNNIKGQISSFANNVLAEETEESRPYNSPEDLERLCAEQNEEINRLRRINEELAKQTHSKEQNDHEQTEDTSWTWNASSPPNTPKEEDTSAEIADLKATISKLENDKKDLLGNLELLDSEYQQNSEQLVSLKKQLQIDYDDLEDRYEELKRKQDELLAKSDEDQRVILELKSIKQNTEEGNNDSEEVKNLKAELAMVSSNTAALSKLLDDTRSASEGELKNIKEELKLALGENKILVGELKKAQATVASFEEKSRVDAENCKKLDMILAEYERQVSSLKEEIGALKSETDKHEQLEMVVKEKEEAHKKYVSILSDNVRKYIDSEEDFEQCNGEDDPQVAEFSNQVASIFKILLELKRKNGSLESDLYNITQEKTNLLTEKNHEIEKLLQNSEILSQEVITKSQTIKEFESECNDLIKNNDLLINELERYKKNSGLQTISESNEDNLLLLETQLETANKRIEELECGSKTIEEEPSEEDLIGKLETENAELKNCVRQLEEEQKEAVEDKESLIAAYERMKADLENTEYQYTEINVSVEAMREECENQKRKIEGLLKQNYMLEKMNVEYERNNQEVRTQLNGIREKLLDEEDARKQFENQVRNLNEKLQKAKMNETSLKLQYDTASKELASMTEAKSCCELKLKNTIESLEELQRKFAALQKTNEDLEATCKDIEKKLGEQVALMDVPLEPKEEHPNELESTVATLQAQVEELTASKAELTGVAITKHQENITYHNEIQRLSQLLNAEIEKENVLVQQLEELKKTKAEENLVREEIEKLRDQNAFLRQKCEVMAENLLQEQSKVQQVLAEKSSSSEKEEALAKKLERLQSHLMETQEHYTEELLRAEEKNAELQAKVNEIEQREKNSTTMYTSVSIRANQHVETLQNQLQLITNQRDELRRKNSDAEDQMNKQAAALANLQFVLQQFQKDKEQDVRNETERIRRQIGAEKLIQSDLRGEIANLQAQLEESRQGLQAASRLSDQLEYSKQQISTLKTEVSHLKDKLHKSEQQIISVTGQTDGKVDKSLIKNLIIGFVTTNNNLNKDQTQILKIIATVLDFNQQDHDKINLNKPQQGWLGSLLAPQASQGMSQESLSQAFVKFLENESKPRVVPSLLNESSSPSSRKASTSLPPTSRQSPSVLSQVLLPTFADFAQNRNSSSILKDVLKDNS